MADPRRRARRGDGGRAFQEVLSHARSLLEQIASTRKDLRIRSVREAGVLLANWWASLQIGGRPACKLVGLESSWRARALSASNLQRLHSVVAELCAGSGADASAALASLGAECAVPSVYRWLQSLCAPRVLCDKTPAYAEHRSVLLHAEAVFGTAARYIHLVRHPYPSIESGIQLRRDLIRNERITGLSELIEQRRLPYIGASYQRNDGKHGI